MSSSEQPNILFVFTDQQSQRGVGCYGNPHVRTPHIDALAADGVRFANSYCAAPVCGPSRAALVTGRFGHEVGVVVNEQGLNPDAVTMGEVFRDAGYATAWAGKWHVPNGYPRTKPEQVRGFEYLPPEPPTRGRGADTDMPITDRACEFLRRKHDRPFLLGVSLINPHDICHAVHHLPIDPPADESLPPLPANHRPAANEPAFITDCRNRDHYGDEIRCTKQWTDHAWRNYLRTYHELCTQVDGCIGRLTKTLEETGLAENTLVVFTSDHGEGCAEQRWIVKLILWEAVARVPLILRWPGRIAPRSVRSQLASGVDLLPTMCDFAGIAPPRDVTGTSLRSAIDEASGAGQPFVAMELYPTTKNLDAHARMIRSSRYKYLAFSYGRQREMLFDLLADPGETHDLANEPAHQATLHEHRGVLVRWIARTHDHFTMP